MSLAHLTLPTRDVAKTADFLERTLGFHRKAVAANSPVEAVWLDLGSGQEIHILFVDGFEISPFEGEFGRHVALFRPLAEFPAIKERLRQEGAEFLEEIRATPFERFFFREPINGYVLEVIDAARAASSR